MKTVTALSEDVNEDKVKNFINLDNKVDINDLIKRKKNEDHLRYILNIKISAVAFILIAIIFVTISL